MAKINIYPVVTLIAALLLSGCGGKSQDRVASFKAATPTVSSQVPSEPENFARENPDAGKVDFELRNLTGEGPTLQLAVKNALLPYVMETNGVTVASGAADLDSGLNADLNDKKVNASAYGYMDLSGAYTQGKISGFRILSQSKDVKSGLHSVSIEIKIPKFVRSQDDTRLSIAVVPFKTGSSAYTVDKSNVASTEVAQRIRQNLVNALTKSGRVSVLDRDFESETGAELQRIATRNAPEQDLARLGQKVATDYVLVGSIDQFGYARHERALHSSDRTLVSHSGGAVLTLRLINVATGALVDSDTVSISLPETYPTTLGASVDVTSIVNNLTGALSEQATTKVINKLFPVTIVSVEGDDVVLSQGGDSVVEGKYYEIVVRGKEIKDPQTGRSLGRVEKPCCILQVEKVTPQMSYGKLVEKNIDVASAFAPGAFEVRGQVHAPASAVVATAAVAANVAKKTRSPPAVSPTPAQMPAETPKANIHDKDW